MKHQNQRKHHPETFLHSPGISRSFKTIIYLAALFMMSNRASAVVKTQDWQESHKGYSIELIPGTGENGIAEEYVAAGTAYSAAYPNGTAWHFMRLDANGTMLTSRIVWCQPQDQVSFRVVDIAAEPASGPTPSNRFWITIQARGTTTGLRDYVYVHGVDAGGNDLTVNPQNTIMSTDNGHQNLYPTHSYFSGNSLYVCGYAAANTQFPSVPNNNYSNKYGFMLKCNVNAFPFTYAITLWDTYNSDVLDFDMPLRIAPSSFISDFPLLVTGALNTGDPKTSGVLVMKYNSPTSYTANGLLYPYSTTDPDEVKGIYGVDMRGSIGADPMTGTDDYVVLVNFFNDYQPYERTWGWMRMKHSLNAYPSNYYSYVSHSNTIGWAKQFYELHTDDYGPNLYDQDIIVLGEQYDLRCHSTPGSPSLVPSTDNVNPFISFAPLGDGWWYNGQFGFYGYNPGQNNFGTNVVYLSSEGTKAVNEDYMTSPFGVGNALEDMSRLHTFGSIKSHYHDPYMPAAQNAVLRREHAMVVPVGEHPNSSPVNPNLVTKFLTTNKATYYEESCEKMMGDCPYPFFTWTFDVGTFSTPLYEGVSYLPGSSVFTLMDNLYIPNNIDCSTGHYKPAGVGSLANSPYKISLYPNPASDYVNVQLPGIMSADDKFSFVLTDMAGKEVFRTNKATAGQSNIRVQLPGLVPGVYMSVITVNGSRQVEKISIN